MKMEYIDKELIDLTRGIIWKRAKLTRFEKIKIFFGFMKEPKKRKVKVKSFFQLIPKVKAPKFKYNIGEIA